MGHQRGVVRSGQQERRTHSVDEHYVLAGLVFHAG